MLRIMGTSRYRMGAHNGSIRQPFQGGQSALLLLGGRVCHWFYHQPSRSTLRIRMSNIDLICKKMPLSSMTRGILERCFAAERLDALFAQHAQQQYTRNLLFSTTCHLLLQVVLQVKPSVYAANQTWEGDFPVSKTALYDKLNKVEPAVAAALVRMLTQDMIEIQDALDIVRPSLLPGFDVRILDGNCLAASEKRLAVHRQLGSAALPGKSLVVMDPARKMLVDVFPCEDGHAQERSLLDQVIPTVIAGQLWLADRNFCTLGFLGKMAERDAKVLFRRHGGLPLRETSGWSKESTNSEGQRMSECQVDVGGRTYRLIRVQLTQATRGGDKTLDLICDVADTVSAETLAALYRKRWRLETAFQHLEKHLKSEINPLAYPRAALFGFCLALVAYNIYELALSTLDVVHQAPVSERLSTYYIGHEIATTLTALVLLTSEEDWHFIAAYSAAEFAHWLHGVAQNIQLKKYQKSVRGVKKAQKKTPHDPQHPHVSTHRLLNAEKNKS